MEPRKRPVSIPNPEAKLGIADDTAPFGDGKVGRRQGLRFSFLILCKEYKRAKLLTIKVKFAIISILNLRDFLRECNEELHRA